MKRRIARLCQICGSHRRQPGSTICQRCAEVVR